MAFSILSIIRCAPAAIGPFDSRNGSETAAKNQGFAGRTATHSKAQGGNATTISWSALSSTDPMQITAKIVSLIDTARYRNWPRRLVLYIYVYICICFVGGFPGIVWRLQRSCKPLHSGSIRLQIRSVTRRTATVCATVVAIIAKGETGRGERCFAARTVERHVHRRAEVRFVPLRWEWQARVPARPQG